MRTAIVHDWFQGYHGAERTVEAIRSGLFSPPNAPDVFTFHAARELLPDALARSITRESRVARLPGIRQRGDDPGRWRYLVPLMPGYFQRLPLEPYDLVVATSHAFAVQARPRPDAAFLCYCFTPLRYAWLPETDRRMPGAMRRRLRRLDLEASRRPDAFVAISGAVRDRIRRFYGREADVIHPPVDVDDFFPTREKEPARFLWAHRFVSYKRPEIVVEAFRGLPYRLTMIGVGPLAARLERDLPANVEILSWLPRRQLVRRFEEASGFLHIAEEDFGITMVEALAAGTPVVALGAGGALDIIRNGLDGILVDRPEVEQVRDAVRRLASREWDRGELAARAQEFSRLRFVERLSARVSELAEARGLYP